MDVKKKLIPFNAKLEKNIENQQKKENRHSFTNTVLAILERYFEEQEKN